MIARCSQALVEMPSASAISSTLALTECGSRRLIRAIGSSPSISGSSGRGSSSAAGVIMVGSADGVGTETANSGSPATIRTSTEAGARSALIELAASERAWIRARRVEESIAVPRRCATCWVLSSARAAAFLTPSRTEARYGERSMTPL